MLHVCCHAFLAGFLKGVQDRTPTEARAKSVIILLLVSPLLWHAY